MAPKSYEVRSPPLCAAGRVVPVANAGRQGTDPYPAQRPLSCRQAAKSVSICGTRFGDGNGDEQDDFAISRSHSLEVGANPSPPNCGCDSWHLPSVTGLEPE